MVIDKNSACFFFTSSTKIKLLINVHLSFVSNFVAECFDCRHQVQNWFYVLKQNEDCNSVFMFKVAQDTMIHRINLFFRFLSTKTNWAMGIQIFIHFFFIFKSKLMKKKKLFSNWNFFECEVSVFTVFPENLKRRTSFIIDINCWISCIWSNNLVWFYFLFNSFFLICRRCDSESPRFRLISFHW